jgi:CHAD domain-containing protein
MRSSHPQQLRSSESPMAGFRRISRSLVRDLAALEHERPLEERIHASRVATKKLRAYLSLLRPAIGDAAFRDVQRPLRKAAHALSVHRDRDVAVSTLDVLERRVGRGRRKPLAAAAHSLKKMSRSEKRLKSRRRALKELNCALEASVEDFAALKTEKRGWDVLGPGYTFIYGRCRREIGRWSASKRPEDSHRFRRYVKYLGFQLTRVEETNPEAIGWQTAALKDLGHRLGRLHDCTNLEVLLRDPKVKRRVSSRARKEIRRAAREWERDLTRECLPLAEKLFASTPEEFTSRLEHGWRRSRRPRPARRRAA